MVIPELVTREIACLNPLKLFRLISDAKGGVKSHQKGMGANGVKMIL